MAQRQGTITDSQIRILRGIEKEFIKRGGSGLGEMMKALIVGLREKLDGDNGRGANPHALYESNKAEEKKSVQKYKAGNLAKKRRQEIQGFFNNYYLGRVEIPLPDISDKEFKVRKRKNQALFFRPATKDLSYKDFLRALGQGNHWTVMNKSVGWEEAKQGYWFWAEVQAECPRLGTSWNDLINKLNLLSLEEYVIVFHTHKALTNIVLDRNTRVWLRTRYKDAHGSNVLDVRGWYGLVDTHISWPGNLQDSYNDQGGRLAETV